MTPVEALRELTEGVTHEDEVAKRLWEKGHLTHGVEALLKATSGNLQCEYATYCPLSRYIYAETGIKAPIGVEAWYGARGSGTRGHLPAVLRRFVQAYDNGDYDNLI